MSETNTKKYFNLDDLKRFKALEGKTLLNVIYFVWINRVTENSPFVFIDKINIQFSDNTEIILWAGEESDALCFVDAFDFETENTMLKKEFEGKIVLKAHSANEDKFWKEVLNGEIKHIQLSKESEQYLSDAIILDFGQEKRLIAVSPEEGIIIDFFEDI